jgi:hypothetical protein
MSLALVQAVRVSPVREGGLRYPERVILPGAPNPSAGAGWRSDRTGQFSLFAFAFARLG